MDNGFDLDNNLTTIKRFLTGKLLQSGMSGYVVGLSGGIDSAVSCALAVEAVSADRVLGLVMPYRTSSADSAADAQRLIDKLGIDYRRIDISPMIDAYFPAMDASNRLRAGNKMARERMAILFDVAHETGRLVLGTGNRTEICLGYTTWFGDSACSLNPIGELYKSEIRATAAHLGVPQEIIDKPPSADLWSGQTDEGEIGVTHEQIDRILRRLIDEGERSLTRLEREGLDTADVSRVISMLNRNAFKRRLPDIAPLGRLAIPDNLQIQN